MQHKVLETFGGAPFTPNRLQLPESLPGGARVVGVFNPELVSRCDNMDFSVHPHTGLPLEIDRLSVSGIIKKVVSLFPGHRIDVGVMREPFTSGNADSFSTSTFGIHSDGYLDGFFVLSTDEPTVFYSDNNGSNPQQARPGELVFVPGDCLHSAPTPSHDGERVRVKLIPHKPIANPETGLLKLLGRSDETILWTSRP